MKYFIYLINTCLLVLIPISVITTEPSTTVTSANFELKKLKSEKVILPETLEKIKQEEETPKVEEVAQVVEEEPVKEEEVKPAIPVENKHADLDMSEVPIEKPKVIEVPTNDNLGMFVGTMSGYGPDCYGCSGLVAYKGIDVRNNIYYNDSEYGRIRIVAGDRSLPFGTVLKVESTKLPVQNVIVLDRGGDIGFNGVFLFDLLFDSQASARQFGISLDTKFTVLRRGF